MVTVNKNNTTKEATKNGKYSIENMRAVNNCGKTLAFFTLDVQGVKIYNLTLVDGKDGVFVGFDDYYLLYKPAEGEEMQAGFDAMKLQIMINGKFDPAIDNLSDCFEQVELEPAL